MLKCAMYVAQSIIKNFTSGPCYVFVPTDACVCAIIAILMNGQNIIDRMWKTASTK